MRSIAVIILFTFFARAHCKELVANHIANVKDSKEKKDNKESMASKVADVQDNEDEVVDKMADRLFDSLVDKALMEKFVEQLKHRANQKRNTDLDHESHDETTLGKTHPDKGVGTPLGFRSGLRVPHSPFNTARAPRFPSSVPHGKATASRGPCLANSMPLMMSERTEPAQLASQLALTAAITAAAQAAHCGDDQKCNAPFMLLGSDRGDLKFIPLDGDDLLRQGNLGLPNSEPEQKALARKYSVVGNWDNWASFHPLTRKDEKCNAEGPRKDENCATYTADMPVRANQNVEFQIVADGDWKNRFFPAGDGKNILGPTPEGHGQNWHHKAPTESGKNMRVKFFPTAGAQKQERKVQMELV